MTYDKQKYKQILIETFKAFIAFCQQNDIIYFVAGGTMLGAVRHQNMIPWDDDVDVYLLREDYNRFLSLKGHVSKPYAIIDWSDEGYEIPFAKWINRDTTLWEVEETPTSYGLYIDIFPLDEFNDRDMALRLKRTFDRQVYYVRHSSHVWTKHLVLEAIRHGRVVDLLTMLRDTFYFRPRKAFYIQQMRKVNDLIVQSRQKGGRWLLAASGVYSPEKELFEAVWFNHSVLLPFEGFEVNAPSNYVAYLTIHYGDYMQLPPEEKRVASHEKCFVDLQHGYSLSEIRKQLHFSK